jgi:palmitoyltransferase ZDHHC9/14/18
MNSSSEILNLKNLEFKPNYQLWKGNSKFFLNGLIYAGPNYKYGLITLFYTIAYSINGIIVILLGKLLIKKEYSNQAFILAIIQGILALITSSLCTLCIFSDPGVLPRNSYNMEIYNNCLLDPTSEKFYFLKGRRYKVKICSTCMIQRPLGTSHCRVCDSCVERYDHHCPWVGNCIGKNNYRYFYFFLVSFNFISIMNLAISIHRLLYQVNAHTIAQLACSILV